MNKDIPPLNLPSFNLRTRIEGEQVQVFDVIRDKFVVLTPEEYVRQHFVNYLVHYLHYPPTVVANEIGIKLNGSQKRCDTVVFGPDTRPLMIIEYKAPGVEISQSVFDQIVRYNMQLHAKYLVVSNGMHHFCCVMNYSSDSYNFLPLIPDYRDIISPFSQN